MTRMISRDYHFRYHSAYYKVHHRFLPKTYTKLFSIKGCCFCCCCFQCNFPYLIVGIRAWFAGLTLHSLLDNTVHFSLLFFRGMGRKFFRFIDLSSSRIAYSRFNKIFILFIVHYFYFCFLNVICNLILS
jgi:hypothetical protein